MSITKDTTEILLPEATLQGDLLLPNEAKGLVLFAHGSGSSRHSPRNQKVAGVLREAGFGTLLFDLLTAEEEKIDARTRQLRFDIPLLARRLGGVTRWVLKKTEVRVGYFGASTGAAAALVAAAELGETIGAVVSRGGRPDLAAEELERVTAPTLLIVGADDTAVIPLNESAFERLRCEKNLRLVRGATHLFEEPGTMETAARLACEWFARHLTPERSPA